MSWTNSASGSGNNNSSNDPGVWNQQQQKPPWNAPPSPHGQPIAWSTTVPAVQVVPQNLQQPGQQQQGFHAMQQQPLYHSLPPLQKSFPEQQQLPPQSQFRPQQPLQFSKPPIMYHAIPPRELYNRNPPPPPPLPPPPPPPPPRAPQQQPRQQQRQQEDMEESDDDDDDEESSPKQNDTSDILPLQNSCVIDLFTPRANKNNAIDVVDLTVDNEEEEEEEQNDDNSNFGGLYDDTSVVVFTKKKKSDSSDASVLKPDTDDATQQHQQQLHAVKEKPIEQALLEEAKQEMMNAQNLPSADRREALLRLKVKLNEARSKRRRHHRHQSNQTRTVQQQSPQLEPITALQNPLVIHTISGPDELVRFHRHYRHHHDDDDDSSANSEVFEAIRQDAMELSSPFSTKRKNLQENLKVLKRRLSVLKETKSKRMRLEEDETQKGIMHDETVEEEEMATVDDEKKEAEFNKQQQVQVSLPVAAAAAAAATTNTNNNRASKEDLKKRQERLQVKMGIVYWNKLVAKQSKFLDEQETKVKEIQDELYANESLIQVQERRLQECDDTIARGPIVQSMVASATRQVLETRRALRELKQQRDGV